VTTPEHVRRSKGPLFSGRQYGPQPEGDLRHRWAAEARARTIKAYHRATNSYTSAWVPGYESAGNWLTRGANRSADEANPAVSPIQGQAVEFRPPDAAARTIPAVAAM